MSKKLAIIPARGGSKRIPRKNIKEFCGKPIIAYSIEAAINSNLFDEVMVSTDDDEIAQIAETYGASVPFQRSIDCASDFATTYDVVQEVLTSYSQRDQVYQYACCIYPTAPFVNAKLLDRGYRRLVDGGFTTVFPIVAFDYPIQRALIVEDNGAVVWADTQYRDTRSQDLPMRYHDSGSYYWMNVDRVLTAKMIIGEDVAGIVTSSLQAHDIDTVEDWKIAELKYQSITNE